ncbi:MAG: glutathione S-transferase [Wenzhouxiangellaceae bacterium]|nr:glutathione S-transferase [Wenzhouxiangellaceae bacterium]
MRLHTFPGAPSPRRVQLLLAVKGASIEEVVVDLRAGQQRGPAFSAINPRQTVPFLELHDGTGLSECAAISVYLDEKFPEPPMYGTSAEERARIVDADHFIEFNGLVAVMEAFRNASPAMRDRALPGPRDEPQIPALAERGRRRFAAFLEDFDALLADRPFAGGSRFSVADITAFVTLEFARGMARLTVPDGLSNVAAWQRRVRDVEGMAGPPGS